MPLEDELDRLEASIRQLHVEWEKFFGGVERRPPTQLHAKVEGLVRQYSNADMRNAAERFRYQSLATRYSTFNEMWNKRLRALEEGRPLGLHGSKAMALASATAAQPQRVAERTPPAPAAGAGSGEFRVSDAARDESALRHLYEQFARSRQQTGEPPVKFESFHKLVAQQAGRLMSDRGARAVDFRVETKDGKVSLKAKAVK